MSLLYAGFFLFEMLVGAIHASVILGTHVPPRSRAVMMHGIKKVFHGEVADRALEKSSSNSKRERFELELDF